MNYNVNQRDTIIFGSPYDPERYVGGIRNFDEMKPDALRSLVKEGFADNEESQNEGPTIGDFLDYSSVCGSASDIMFSGYAVAPTRSDYRVTIDEVRHTIPKQDADALVYFVDCFRSADEFSTDIKDDLIYCRAWWD